MRFYRGLFLAQLEDALLAVGGLMAALPPAFADTSNLVVVSSLVLAGVGKATPSLVGQLFASPSGPFPQDSHGQRSRPGPDERDWWAVAGDSALLLGTVAAGLEFWLGTGTPAFLLTVGFAFSIKAFFSLVELWILAGVLDDPMTPAPPSDDPRPTRSTRLGSSTTENVLLGALGAGAIVLAHLGAANPAGSALGLAALGKAIPSFIAAATASSSA